MNRTFYALHDSDPKKHGGMFEVDEFTAFDWNEKGFGIFWTVNEFDGPRRIDNLVKINSWAVDLDKGTKEEMRAKIAGGLRPSLVIETKRGYHVYFNAKNAHEDHYDEVMNSLVEYYGADQNAKDIARVLRVPGYNHMKDPKDPFPINTVYESSVSYLEANILDVCRPKRRQQFISKKKTREEILNTDPFWVAVGKLGAEDALMKLSGSELVNREVFDFKPNKSGTKNILVNGATTSCWVDVNGMIGSLDKGGPTIAQWLRYYGHSYGKIASALKELFPELKNVSK